MSDWSSPFAKWVIKGWMEHSKAIGGPSIVRAVRSSLADPVATKKRAVAAAGRRKKNTAKSPAGQVS